MAGRPIDVPPWTRQHPVATALLTVGVVVFFWLRKVNRFMRMCPPEAEAYATDSPWTEDAIRKTYERVSASPIDSKPHMPPKLDRRYVVLGGSGLVGGFLIAQLLERGHDPSAIRIIDFRPPTRRDFLHGPAARIKFCQGDMTSSASINAAFEHPWDPSVASLPLTVLHTAAAVRPSERSSLIYDRCRIPNVVGTANVLSAAKAAGASVFIFTSSSHNSLRPVTWFLNAPWRFWPRNYFQIMTEEDFRLPLRPHGDYFSNYSRSKAEAERLVCAADSKAEGFRTGTIRPGSAVYGHSADLLLGSLLRQGGTIPTFAAPWIQTWIHGANLAIAQLQLEAALLGPHADNGLAGRPFLVTDPGPPPRFRDAHKAAEILARTPIKVVEPPPVLLLLVATGVEAWCNLLRRLPVLTRLGLREPEPPLYLLQPACFDASIPLVVDDADARRCPEEGIVGTAPPWRASACSWLSGTDLSRGVV